MNRTDRLMGIIAHLQAKKYQTAEQLAEHFNMSVRTVYRDLRAMNEIGVPVGFEAGQGYYIVGGYFLPPVSLTAEEANALAIIEPLVIRFADKSIQAHYGTAISKIKQVLGHVQRRNLEQIQSQVAHYIPNGFAHMLPSTDYLTTIQKAIIEQRILRIEYLNNKEEASTREVEPIGLTFYSLNWHLIAWCHLRQEYRDFRTSRIQSLSLTLQPFRIQKHISLNDYLKDLDELVAQYPRPA
ncbi:MAG: WYL domain-containing protein [Bacteroidetes bacterium]|nr:WYL domain-containing protein [Bacteroidota bacterium]